MDNVTLSYDKAIEKAKQDIEAKKKEIEEKEEQLQKRKARLSELKRNKRTHRLCTRGGMLEKFIGKSDAFDNDKIMEILKVAFSYSDVKEMVDKLNENAPAELENSDEAEEDDAEIFNEVLEDNTENISEGKRSSKK